MQANLWHHKLFHFHLPFWIWKAWKRREKITILWISRQKKGTNRHAKIVSPIANTWVQKNHLKWQFQFFTFIKSYPYMKNQHHQSISLFTYFTYSWFSIENWWCHSLVILSDVYKKTVRWLLEEAEKAVNKRAKQAKFGSSNHKEGTLYFFKVYAKVDKKHFEVFQRPSTNHC